MAYLNDYDTNAEPNFFEPIPEGSYQAKIIQAEKKDISKKNSYGECLNLTWELDGGEYDRRLIWQRLNLWAENMNNVEKVRSIANSDFAAIRQATGVLTPRDTDELLHIPCVIQVSINKDPNGQYDPRNEVKKVKPLDEQTSAVMNGSPQGNNSQSAAAVPWGNNPQSAAAVPWGNNAQGGAAKLEEDDVPF